MGFIFLIYFFSPHTILIHLLRSTMENHSHCIRPIHIQLMLVAMMIWESTSILVGLKVGHSLEKRKIHDLGRYFHVVKWFYI